MTFGQSEETKMVSSGEGKDEVEVVVEGDTNQCPNWTDSIFCSCGDERVFRRGVLGRRCEIPGVEVV